MAMAISGAAANPNMGRASSPALAFLMTVFNVRLGWWLGNPRYPRLRPTAEPRRSVCATLLLELFGGTTDDRKFVNLSDGGHFDNLGVYELVRRGCRYIVVCDAGQDGRSCSRISAISSDAAAPTSASRSTSPWIASALGERRRPGASEPHTLRRRQDPLSRASRARWQTATWSTPRRAALRGSKPAHENGYLVYIKPSLTGDEPQDMLEYYRRIPEFPHQSTADQWFDESQFESYRKLGMHIGEDDLRSLSGR